MLDLLGSLVEKSLVMLEERDDGARYRMLETIRDYAREKLQQRGEAAATAARHCEHYFAMAKAGSDGLRGCRSRPNGSGALETELDNMRAAMALALAGGVDPFIAVKFAVAMQGFWMLRGYASEGRGVVQAALALPAIQASDMAQAHALYVGAALGREPERPRRGAADARDLPGAAARLGNPVDIAATLSTLSLARLQAGDTVGAGAGEREALEIFRRWATGSARPSGCFTSGRYRSTQRTTDRPSASLSRLLIWPGTSSTANLKASASDDGEMRVRSAGP